MAKIVLVGIGELAASISAAKNIAEARKIGDQIVVLVQEKTAEIDALFELIGPEGHVLLEEFGKKIEGLENLLKEEKEAHIQTKSDANDFINELKEQLASTEKKAEEGNAEIEVQHDKVTYVVALPKFKFDGVEYDGKDLKNHPALIKELVKIGSGVLVKKQ